MLNTPPLPSYQLTENGGLSERLIRRDFPWSRGCHPFLLSGGGGALEPRPLLLGGAGPPCSLVRWWSSQHSLCKWRTFIMRRSSFSTKPWIRIQIGPTFWIRIQTQCIWIHNTGHNTVQCTNITLYRYSVHTQYCTGTV